MTLRSLGLCYHVEDGLVATTPEEVRESSHNIILVSWIVACVVWIPCIIGYVLICGHVTSGTWVFWAIFLLLFIVYGRSAFVGGITPERLEKSVRYYTTKGYTTEMRDSAEKDLEQLRPSAAEKNKLSEREVDEWFSRWPGLDPSLRLKDVKELKDNKYLLKRKDGVTMGTAPACAAQYWALMSAMLFLLGFFPLPIMGLAGGLISRSFGEYKAAAMAVARVPGFPFALFTHGGLNAQALETGWNWSRPCDLRVHSYVSHGHRPVRYTANGLDSGGVLVTMCIAGGILTVLAIVALVIRVLCLRAAKRCTEQYFRAGIPMAVGEIQRWMHAEPMYVKDREQVKERNELELSVRARRMEEERAKWQVKESLREADEWEKFGPHADAGCGGDARFRS